MKLKKEFITHMSGEEQLMISAGGSFNGMVRSNKTAAFIIDLLKEETSKEKIVATMLDTYDASEEIISADVEKVIEALRSIGALDE